MAYSSVCLSTVSLHSEICEVAFEHVQTAEMGTKYKNMCVYINIYINLFVY
ncbi:hypothetical protein EXN66_Car010861 [Channa argus]|uniref:Uncharacterized protein n=1 Tax=Channa argus TaxID=215402 RepID=A0A6G1PY34_CHAAH|nr:hypothetical protein EXN66_Car010861 [Channa argus]